MPENIPDNLEEQIKQLIAQTIQRPLDDLKPETNFYNDLGVDSIKGIEITVNIERKFKVKVRDEQIPQITTVGEAVQIVRDALAKQKNSSN